MRAAEHLLLTLYVVCGSSPVDSPWICLRHRWMSRGQLLRTCPPATHTDPPPAHRLLGAPAGLQVACGATAKRLLLRKGWVGRQASLRRSIGPPLLGQPSFDFAPPSGAPERPGGGAKVGTSCPIGALLYCSAIAPQEQTDYLIPELA